MVSSSSTRRAARLAQKGKGKRIRFQGGTFFPLIIMAILVLGLGTIVYARQSQPAVDSTPPTSEDHWHAAYGFSLCDQPEYFQLAGAKEEADAQGRLISTAFLRTGVHSHNDGVIHWHAYTSAAVGRNAQLGVFTDVYEVELTDDTLRFPDDQGGKEYIEGETMCDGEPGELKVIAWNNYQDTGTGTTYVSNFDDIPFDRDGLVYTIAFQPSGTEVTMPPWAADLPALGAVDTDDPEPTQEGSVPPEPQQLEGSVPIDSAPDTTGG
ncbi:MAG: hypothetical protein ACR2HP_06945 [Ilumatobacteraceae bacterium]